MAVRTSELNRPRTMNGMADHIVHVDLHLGNIAFALPNLDSLSVEELYGCIEESQHILLGLLDSDYYYEDSNSSHNESPNLPG